MGRKIKPANFLLKINFTDRSAIKFSESLSSNFVAHINHYLDGLLASVTRTTLLSNLLFPGLSFQCMMSSCMVTAIKVMPFNEILYENTKMILGHCRTGTEH